MSARLSSARDQAIDEYIDGKFVIPSCLIATCSSLLCSVCDAVSAGTNLSRLLEQPTLIPTTGPTSSLSAIGNDALSSTPETRLFPGAKRALFCCNSYEASSTIEMSFALPLWNQSRITDAESF
jgi:hypothetical protein